MWRASAQGLLQEPIKFGVVSVAWSVLLGSMYLLAHHGIRFIYDTAGLGPFLMSRLWFLLLCVIMLLLVVSQLPTVYSTLVRAPETRYWMTLPVSARALCRAKWLESSFYSSWAVVMLIVPLCLAYLHVLGRPWWLVSWAGVLLIPLMGIATAFSTLVLLVWLRWIGRLVIRRELIPVGFVLACVALFWFLGERHREAEQQDVWFVALQALLPRMRFAMSMWLPSSWAATALDAGLNDRWLEGWVYVGLLWTTALMGWRLLDHLAAGLLFPVLREHAHAPEGGPARQALTSTGAGSSARRRAVITVPWWARQPFLASLAKDVLLVIRDPMQWSQALMFFGLLGAYFGNIHRIAQVNVEPSWRVGVASLNLACTLLVFGSLAVRFIFPQMSLEGRSLWLLRIAPYGMRRLLRSKLVLYSVIAVGIVDGLLWLSASRLGVPVAVRWWLGAVGTLGAVTIVGLTVGLGAWWMNLHAQDAAQIVSSSRGALTLVWMLGYVACVIAALIVGWVGWRTGMYARFLLAGTGLAIASIVSGWWPVQRGSAALERGEEAS